MSRRSLTERALFADLTRLFTAMKDAPHAKLEAAVEARFRSFVRTNPMLGVHSLEVTMTWSLPEGATSWPMLKTEYQLLTESAENPHDAPQTLLDQEDQPSSRIIAFPRR